MSLQIAIPLLALAGVLQTTLLPHFVLLNVKPDLVLILVVVWGTIRGPQEGIAWGLVGGLILDLLGASPFGTVTVTLVVVAFLTSIGGFNLVRKSLVLSVIIMFGATMTFYGLFLFILQATGANIEWETQFHATLIPSSVVNTICTPAIYWFVQWLSERFEPNKNRDW